MQGAVPDSTYISAAVGDCFQGTFNDSDGYNLPAFPGFWIAYLTHIFLCLGFGLSLNPHLHYENPSQFPRICVYSFLRGTSAGLTEKPLDVQKGVRRLLQTLAHFPSLNILIQLKQKSLGVRQ